MTQTRRRERHGMFGTPEYRAWSAMIERCKKGFKLSEHYYDRGIGVCEEWKNSFVAFYKHIGKRPTPEHTLDRIDNDRGYEVGNVRWTSRLIQTRNRRVSKTNKVGVAGVQWHTVNKKWYASIGLYGQRITLGFFDDVEEAIMMRLSAEEQLWSNALGIGDDK